MIFKIASKVNIQYIRKFLFVFVSDFGEYTIVRFYLANLFKSLFIMSFYSNDFQHNDSTNPTRTNIIVNLIFMEIIIVFHKFLSKTVKHIKIFYLKLLEIYLNTTSEMVVSGI